MYKRLLISTLVMTIAACDRAPSGADKSAAEASNTTQQINDIGTFTTHANLLLNQARGLLQNPNTQDTELVALIQEFEKLNKTASTLDVSKEQLLEPELLSTLGSLYSKRAAFYAKEPTKAGAFAAKGIRYLDKAVETYPDNITARLNRGIVSMHMPEFLNKTESARQDFEFIRNNHQFSGLPEATRSMVESFLNEANARLAKNDTVAN